MQATCPKCNCLRLRLRLWLRLRLPTPPQILAITPFSRLCPCSCHALVTFDRDTRRCRWTKLQIGESDLGSWIRAGGPWHRFELYQHRFPLQIGIQLHLGPGECDKYERRCGTAPGFSDLLLWNAELRSPAVSRQIGERNCCCSVPRGKPERGGESGVTRSLKVSGLSN